MTTAAQAMKAIAAGKSTRELTRVVAVEDMTDEAFIRHMEHRHPEDLELTFTVRPGETERKMETRIAFEALHALRHRDTDRRFDHDHEEVRPNGRSTEH